MVNEKQQVGNKIPAQKRSRKYVVPSLTIAIVLAATYPNIPARVFATGNQYEWVKHDDLDLLGGRHHSAAMSADGNHLILGGRDGGELGEELNPLFVSHDFGETWENIAEDVDAELLNDWQAVDISNDGQTMVTASAYTIDLETTSEGDGKIYVSEDGGDTWEDISPADVSFWDFVAVSGDGSTIAALSSDDMDTVYVTENSGDSWTTNDIENVNEWETLSISDDGNKILVGGENSTSMQTLQLSTNSGESWTEIAPAPEDLNFTTKAAMSADGSKIVVTFHSWNSGHYDEVYVSSNNGENWTDITPEDPDPNDWTALAMSDDGTTIALLDFEDKMYVSRNSGADWNEEDPGEADNDENTWRSIGTNTDGSRIVAVSNENAYTGQGAGPDGNTATVKNFTDAETGKAIRLTTPNGTTITCHSPAKESNLSVQDVAYSYPLGLVDFCFSGAAEDNEIVLIFVTDLKPDQVVVRKYNPDNESYATVTEASVTETTFNGQHALQVTYTIVDNGPLDTDPDLGEVADPVGLGVLGVGAPNTGLAREH